MKKLTKSPEVRKEKSLAPLQLKFLELLYNNGGWMSRTRMCRELGYENLGMQNALGLNDPEKRAEADKKSPSLLTLGLIECIDLDIDGVSETNYRVTESGRKYIEEL